MPRLDEQGARTRVLAARVAGLGLLDESGAPTLVPITFALVVGAGPDIVYFAVDHKPKSTRDLARIRRIRHDPRVCLLIDAYDDRDWSQLWWVRGDGSAEVRDGGPGARAGRAALQAKYPQYSDHPPVGPVVAVTVQRWVGWSAGGG